MSKGFLSFYPQQAKVQKWPLSTTVPFCIITFCVLQGALIERYWIINCFLHLLWALSVFWSLVIECVTVSGKVHSWKKQLQPPGHSCMGKNTLLFYCYLIASYCSQSARLWALKLITDIFRSKKASKKSIFICLFSLQPTILLLGFPTLNFSHLIVTWLQL